MRAIQALRRSLPVVLLSLGIVLYAVKHVRRLLVSAVVLSEMRGSSAPTYVYAGIPFVIHDGYATQLCISNRSGRSLPPFVVPAPVSSIGSLRVAPAHVQAGTPFLVHDGWSTQLCASTRSGEPLVPFVVP
jgi:hypothetical protein